ncbi:MAG: hemerythrin domain-containing protein [Bacteroidia bacterium]|nr:hemerythrin domain-containing protein [Bacteroidia bacterium]
MYCLINFYEIETDVLCDYIEDKLHVMLRHQASLIQKYLHQDLYCVCNCTTQFSLIQVLFQRLEDEMEQVFRKEKLILFPLIRENVNNPKPHALSAKVFDLLRESHNKMIQISQKIRQLTSNYFAKPGWNAAAKLCVNELFDFEQSLQQWIHLEEGVLYPKVTSTHPEMQGQRVEDELI